MLYLKKQSRNSLSVFYIDENIEIVELGKNQRATVHKAIK